MDVSQTSFTGVNIMKEHKDCCTVNHIHVKCPESPVIAAWAVYRLPNDHKVWPVEVQEGGPTVASCRRFHVSMLQSPDWSSGAPGEFWAWPADWLSVVSDLQMETEIHKSEQKQHRAAAVTQTCRPSALPPAFNLMHACLCTWYVRHTHTHNVQSACGGHMAEQHGQKNEQQRRKREGEKEKRWSWSTIKGEKAVQQKVLHENTLVGPPSARHYISTTSSSSELPELHNEQYKSSQSSKEMPGAILIFPLQRRACPKFLSYATFPIVYFVFFVYFPSQCARALQMSFTPGWDLRTMCARPPWGQVDLIAFQLRYVLWHLH